MLITSVYFVADAVSYFLSLFNTWLSLLAAPFVSAKSDILWIIIPVYISWILTEYYQEKSGTSIGNAISNGFIGLWVGIDWARRIVPGFKLTTSFIGQAVVTLFMFAYGLLVIYEGMKGRRIATFIGRVKEISYLMIVFSPIVYGLVPLTFDTLITIVLFFPVVYGVTEIIDKILPTPQEKPVEPKTFLPNVLQASEQEKKAGK